MRTIGTTFREISAAPSLRTMVTAHCWHVRSGSGFEPFHGSRSSRCSSASRWSCARGRPRGSERVDIVELGGRDERSIRWPIGRHLGLIRRTSGPCPPSATDRRALDRVVVELDAAVVEEAGELATVHEGERIASASDGRVAATARLAPPRVTAVWRLSWCSYIASCVP